MALNAPKRSPIVRCMVCGIKASQANKFEGTKVCDDCSERGREGRDSTTRAVKLQVKTQRNQAQASRISHNGGEVDPELAYSIASGEVFAHQALEAVMPPLLGAGREVVPEHDVVLRDTLAAPDAAALDASANRLELVTRLGTDVAAMAVDAAQTVRAMNSIEKMYCHQLAVLHDTCMHLMSKAALESDPVIAIRMTNLAIRDSEVYQRGALNLKRLRGGNHQVMRIEHVHIAPGAQAIVGTVQTGRAA